MRFLGRSIIVPSTRNAAIVRLTRGAGHPGALYSAQLILGVIHWTMNAGVVVLRSQRYCLRLLQQLVLIQPVAVPRKSSRCSLRKLSNCVCDSLTLAIWN